MKKTLIILAHPDLDSGSIANKTILDKIEGKTNIEIRKISQLYPDFNIDIETEQKALLEADNIIFQFPFFLND